MKAIGLALLLANLLFFGWLHWLAPHQQSQPAAPGGDVPQLVLASEANASQPPPTEQPQANEQAAAAPSSASQPAAGSDASARTDHELLAHVVRCVSIGTFRDLAEVTQASTSLRGSGYEPRTRVAEGEVWAGLWVYLRDLPSRNEAQRAMTLLKQRGITDAYIMPSGESSNEISLGIFSEPARAQRRADEIRALGFTPTIADRTRLGTVYWVDIDLKPTDGFINPADIQGESGRIVRLEIRACPSQATPGQGG